MRRICTLVLFLLLAAATPLRAQNQVPNGSFNGSISGWTPVANFFTEVGYTTAQDHTGGGSGSLYGKWNGSSLVHYYEVASTARLSVTPGVNYTFSAWVRVSIDALGLGSWAGVTFYDAAGNVITSRDHDYVSTAGSWQLRSVTGSVPSNAATMQFTAYGSQTQGQTSWFDDVTFTTSGPAVVLSIGDASATEGSPVPFTITRSGSTSSALNVNYRVFSGTATVGRDLPESRGVVTIPNGSSTVQLSIPTTEDTVTESSETFTVYITAFGECLECQEGNPFATGTIIDNEEPITYSIDDVSVEEGNVATFTVSRTGTTAAAVTFNYSAQSGTAMLGSDLSPAFGSLKMNSGQSSVQIQIPTLEDTAVEQNETFVVKISGAAAGINETGTGTIIDDDDDDDDSQSVSVIAFTASPASVSPGGAATLSWTTLGATSVTISGIAGSLPANGSRSVQPAQTTTYQLTAHGAQSATATAAVTVQVSGGTSAPVITFSANTASVTAGQPVRLTWSVTNAATVVISPAPGTVPQSGSEDVFPGAKVRYILTASGPGGSSSREVNVNVTPAAQHRPLVAFRAVPPAIAPGESVTLVWNTANVQTVTIDGVTSPGTSGSAAVTPSATTSYTLTAVGSAETATATVTVSVANAPAPAMHLRAAPRTIAAGESAILDWITIGASAVCLDGQSLTQPWGSRTVTPPATTTYTLNVAGAAGVVTRTSTVIVDNLLPPAVTTLAGRAGAADHQDGLRAAARFRAPAAMARDSQGNIFVADSGNHVIRRIAPDGLVTTFAGAAGQAGYADGAGGAARFRLADLGGGVAVDADDNVYVADSGNHVIRRITPEGVVTLFAGQAGTGGWVDGTTSEARFFSPSQLAFDGSGNLYVSDSGNHTIRKIAQGNVSTYAGYPGQRAHLDDRGSAARFDLPHGLAFDDAGNLYLVDSRNHAVRRISPERLVSTVAGSSGDTCGFRFGERGGGVVVKPGATPSAPPRLLIADPGLNLILEVDAAGGTRTILGDGLAGDDENLVLNTSFRGPRALLISGGDLIIADTGNHTLRRSSLEPTRLPHRRRAARR